MKLLFLLFVLTACAQEKPAISIEEKLEISLLNTKLLNARIDFNDKKEILRFSMEQAKTSEAQLKAVASEREALLKKLTSKYKSGGVCNFENIQAELVCEKKKEAEKKEGK